MIGLAGLVAGVLLFAANPAANPHGNLADETKYADLLTKYVKDARVDYPALTANRADLDEYLKAVGAVSKSDFDAASKEARMAYLVNAYNAYTIQTIVENFPKPVKNDGGLFSTGNSIKQIKGAWNSGKHKTALGDITLDGIEHENLRKSYETPLLHMALVCASKGCPPLRAEPYFADKLNDQLEDQARTYLASEHGLVVTGDAIKVSSIFKWFKDDFTKKYGTALDFVTKYAPDARRPIVEEAIKKGRFDYLEYDWTLNEQAPKDAPKK
jgi:hypothetical protein